MKMKKFMFGLVLIPAFLMVLPINAAAAPYSGAWLPNDSLVFVIDMTNSSNSNNAFYLYNWGDPVNISDALLLFNDSSLGTAVTVTFAYDGSNWKASANGNEYSLGDSKLFGFFFSYGSSTTDSYELTTLDNSLYYLEPGTPNMEVIVSNANPVPIPAAAWLFGAGVLGLVGIRRKLIG